ncbi:MAG: hypothetical protein R3C53_24540 [Pirellulaceae bacterium]
MLRNRHPLFVAVILLASAVAAVAYACQVPVFRYALERWNADKYRIVVLNDGPLSEAATQRLQPLKNAQQEFESASRIELQVVDIRAVKDPQFIELWDRRPDKKKPLVAAYYPVGSDAPNDRPAYTAALGDGNVEQILASPVRKRIAEGLQNGHSAVWILLETGNADRDQAAYTALANQLALDEDWIQLPTPAELEVEPAVLSKAKIPLQIKFSIVKLKMNDPAEAFLLETLLNSEPDLKSFDEPMAFPVFGRGRVLYALIGKGIAPDTIRSASAFIAGPCSCQVKNQNPGFDLLMMSDWDQAVGDTLVSEPVKSVPADLKRKLTIPPGRASR